MATESSDDRITARLTLFVLLLGVALRAWRYGLGFPLWGDEASVVVNLMDRDFVGLIGPLECNQVAPLLFLWLEKLALITLGPSEWSLRLWPFLASLLALGLFAHLARLALSPRAALLAISVLAVARWPVTMGAVVKPYSLDLLAACGLLTLAVHQLRRPDQARWLLLLTLAAPLALFTSYPAVFVGGAVALALAPTALRGGWRLRAGYVGFGLALVGSFAAVYLLVGRAQDDPSAGGVGAFMREYWAGAFPPRAPLPFLGWLADVHAGRMMAYPIGDGHFGSSGTLVVVLLGLGVLFRARRGALLTLLLVPFALNFVAAALDRYPYGGCCRLSQHLAPGICLAAGVGLGWFNERLLPASRPRWLAGWCAVLGVFGLGQVVADAVHPYRDRETVWIAAQGRAVRGGGPAVVVEPRGEAEAMFRYHLGRSPNVVWGGQAEWPHLASSGATVQWVSLWTEPHPAADRRPPPAAEPALPGWCVVERRETVLPPMRGGHPWRRVSVFRLEAVGGAASLRP